MPTLEPASRREVRQFLVESERRVIVHCQKLIEDENLPAEARRRLTHLIDDAQARLKGLLL